MRFDGDPALMQVTGSGTVVHRRSEVSLEQLAQVRPALLVAIMHGSRVELPGLDGWSFIAKQLASSVLRVVVAAPDDRKEVAFTVGAANDAYATAVWESPAEGPPPNPPWLQIHEIERPADGTHSAELVDVARCIAWAWFEPTWRPETWVPDDLSVNEDVRTDQGIRIASMLRFASFSEPDRQAMRSHIERNLDAIAEEPSEDEIERLAAEFKEMSEEEQTAWLRRQALQIAVMDEMTGEARDLIARHGGAEDASRRAKEALRRVRPTKPWATAWRVACLVFMVLWLGGLALFSILGSIFFGE